MSLNWDASAVPESIRIATRYDERGEPYQGTSLETEALVWHSLGTGIGTITEANAPEVYARVRLLEQFSGAMVWKDGQPCPLTEQDVINHIGLKTNASYKDETRAAWMKRVVGQTMDGFARPVQRSLAARALQTA
jgi:hypothetical protein